MLWRIAFNNSSSLDTLLEKSTVSLEELLEEEDLLQEVKSHHSKLIEFLSRVENLKKLLSLALSRGEKHSSLACEVICSEVWPLVETCCETPDLLSTSWDFLTNSHAPIPTNIAAQFSRIWGVFLQKKTKLALEFLKDWESSQQRTITSFLLKHLDTSPIMDLLLKIISLEELPEGAGVVEWLNDQGLMTCLVDYMHPTLDPDVHATAAQVLLDIITISQSSNPDQPTIGTNSLIRELKSEALVTRMVDYMLDPLAPNSTSTLVNGVAIFIELIRRNYCEIEDENAHLMQQQVDLSDLIRVLSRRLSEFQQLLLKPKSAEAIETTVGKQVPLGFERLRVCELFAELLHLSNMPLLSMVPAEFEDEEDTGSGATLTENITASAGAGVTGALEGGDSPLLPDHNTGREEHQVYLVEKEILKEGLENSTTTTTTTLILQVDSPSPKHPDLSAQEIGGGDKNLPLPESKTPEPLSRVPLALSMRGYSAGDALKLTFIETGVLTTCLDLFFQYPWNNFLHTVVYDMVHQVLNLPLEVGCNRQLIISLFRDSLLTKRISEAQRASDYYAEQPKGVRLGYMGHMTFIADQVVLLLERSFEDLREDLQEFIQNEAWHHYVTRTLRETKERDRTALGGHRPNGTGPGSGAGGGDSEEDEEEEEEGLQSTGGMTEDVASDQFARYLCQQITSDLPDKFDSYDEDEDETPWIHEFDKNLEFDIRGPFADDSSPTQPPTSLPGHRFTTSNSGPASGSNNDPLLDSDEDDDVLNRYNAINSSAVNWNPSSSNNGGGSEDPSWDDRLEEITSPTVVVSSVGVAVEEQVVEGNMVLLSHDKRRAA